MTEHQLPLPDDQRRATYCPEDDKLRLYVGRVSREDYLKLRAEGWTATPKQNCNFVATWTPGRYRTAIKYAGIVEDEDMGSSERAADRAERFAGYRDKRTGEALGRADAYDSQPQAHGFQNAARAERAAAKHDRLADYACDAWSKAEYWTRRTEGVIAHALYKSGPDVRMGRIKVLESELRKRKADLAEYAALYQAFTKAASIADPAEQLNAVKRLSNSVRLHYDYKHPRPEDVDNQYIREHGTDLNNLLTMAKPITAREACALFFSDHQEPAQDTPWIRHLELRLAYENQMLAAQGGRLAHVEIEPGGFFGGKQVHKVCKSPATGRVTSVFVRVQKVSGWHYKVHNKPGTDYALAQFETERYPADAYRPPTEQEKRDFDAMIKAERKAKPVKNSLLINPTESDAQRFQDQLNAQAQKAFDEYKSDNKWDTRPYQPVPITRMTQEQYSQRAKGSYTSFETRAFRAGGFIASKWSHVRGTHEEQPVVCELRTVSARNDFSHAPRSIIVITDKPQKPLPESLFVELVEEVKA